MNDVESGARAKRSFGILYYVEVQRDQKRVGVVCRTSACVQNRKTRRGSLLRRGSQDTGGSAAAASLDRHHTTLLGPATNTINAGDGSNGEGGMGSAPHDMTSVFGLEVHRLKREDLATEDQKRRWSGRGSAKRKTTESESNNRTMPDTPETAARDAAESSSPQQAEVWTERSPRTSQKPLPAYTTLNDRVRQGDTLLKSVRAGRSLRRATQNSIKGALELGLWAASRPEEFVQHNLVTDKRQSNNNEAPSAIKGTGVGTLSRTAAGGGRGGTGGRKAEGRVRAGDSDDSDAGGRTAAGSIASNDRVRSLEEKLRALDEDRTKRTRRKISSRPGAGGAGAGRDHNKRGSGSSRSGNSAISAAAVIGGTVSARGGEQKGGGRGVGVERGADSTQLNEQPPVGNEATPPTLRTSLRLSDATLRPAVAADGKSSVWLGVPGNAPTGGSLTSRSAPPASTSAWRGPRTARLTAPMSARKASPDAPVVRSAVVKEELQGTLKAYILQQRSLDEALSEIMRRRDFDWDSDMRRMMDAVKVYAEGEGMCFEGVHRVMRRQVVAKQRADEVRNIQGSWFPIMMKRVKPISTSSAATVSGAVAVGRGDNKESDPGMPMCMIRLAAALHKVLVSGHMVTPSIFWSLVTASFGPEDHRSRHGQRMILSCLTFVHQRPEDYHGYLVDQSIKIPSSLKQVFVKLQKRHHKGKGGARKSTLISSGGAGIGSCIGKGVLEGGDGGGWGGMSVGAGSDVSDDASDTMSVLSFASRETTHSVFPAVGGAVFR